MTATSAGSDESGFDALERGYEAVLGGAVPADEIARLPPHLRDRLAEMLRAREGLLGPSSSLPSPQVGPFKLLRLLGRGGQGEVWLARDERIDRPVALKLLAMRAVVAEERFARFRREAHLAARLDHPSICPVYESGSLDGYVYLAMRYVEGQTLAQWIEAERAGTAMSLDLVRCAEECALALDAAHRAGVLHRDLKPGNVMIEPDGRPVILDFGLAEDLREGASELTREGQVLGTPAYLAPERLSPAFGTPDQRTDLWALAATFYEAISLRRPFDAPTREGLYQAILENDPRPLARVRPATPRDLSRVFEVALTKAMDRRYATGLDFAADLRAVREGTPIRARPTPQVVRAWKWVKRHRILATFAFTASLAVLLSLLVTGLSLRETAEALRVARARLRLTEAQLLAETDPGAALRAWLAIADEVPRGMVNDAILRLLERTREQAPLLGHGGAVRDVAWSPDSGVIATACADGNLRLYAADTASLTAEIPGVQGANAVAFTSDGERLLVGDERGGVTPFELHSRSSPGQRPKGAKRLAIGSTPVRAIARSERCGELAVACAGGRIAVLDPKGDRILATSPDLFEPVVRVAYAPSGERLFATCATGRVHVLGRKDLAPLAMFGHGGSVVHDAVVDREEAFLLTACADGFVWVWDLASHEVVKKVGGHETAVVAIALHPDGKSFATGSGDRSVVVRSYPACEEVARLSVHSRPLTRIAFAPDGERFVSAAEDGGARLWRTERAECLATLAHDTDIVELARFAPDGKSVLTLARGLTPRVFDVARGELVRVLPEVRARACDADFAPDGRAFAVAYADRSVRIHAWPSTELQHTLRLPEPESEALRGATELSLTYAPTGDRLLVTTNTGAAALFDTANGRVLATPRGLARFYSTGIVRRAAFRVDGRHFATVLPEGRGATIGIWSGDGTELVQRLEGHTEPIEALAWNPVTHAVASASVDGTIRVTGTMNPLASSAMVLHGHVGCVLDVRYSPDGRRLLSAGMDCTARLWDAASGELLRTFAGHDGMIYCAVFAPDGARALTASWDHAVAIWDVATGERLVRHASHAKAVLAASWRHDGAFVASCAADGTARVWPADPVAFARAR